MDLKKKPGAHIEVGPIHIIGEFIDDASQQSPPLITHAKKNQHGKKRSKKNKREKR